MASLFRVGMVPVIPVVALTIKFDRVTRPFLKIYIDMELINMKGNQHDMGLPVKLKKLAISCRFIFAALILLPLYGIVTFIFTMYLFSRIFQKHENIYSASISTSTVF